MKRPNKHVFAIVRVDEFQPGDVPWPNKVSVKEIVWSEDKAQREVERLTKLSEGKQVSYFWQITRLTDPAS